MTDNNNTNKRLFVLDTNVLMHDPTSIFRFEEHDVYVPMVVLEELDRAKKGLSEVSRNVRQVSRFLSELIEDSGIESISDGLPLSLAKSYSRQGGKEFGKLFFQTKQIVQTLPPGISQTENDNQILGVALGLQSQYPSTQVTLVSKDINLRIKAHVLNIPAEDYYNDKVLDDADLLYTGDAELPENFWETHSKDMDSWKEEGKTFYKISGPEVQNWYVNEFLHMNGENPFDAVVRRMEADHGIIELITDYTSPNRSVWGIRARNAQQNYALNLLMDPNVDFVTLLGTAGTGKTLLTLAAGLAQVLDDKRYSEIIMTRVTVPVGEDIGFLPGTEEEKMTPWMGALMDNLEVLTQTTEEGEWGRAATNDLLKNRIKVRSLNFMRGRTFLNKYLIIDEAQNLTSKQMKTLVTRAGPGTKIICLGNIAQIDTPYLTETSSGLTYVVDRFKNWPYAGHITLRRGERSRLADFASDAL